MKELENILKSTAKISDAKTTVISVFHINSIIKDALLLQLKPYDLSIEQYNVLRILRGQKGNPINLQDIQERMINKMSNTTRLVDKLLKKDFVKRITCKKNRRKVEISITKTGLEILKELDPKIDGTESKITSPLNPKELKQLNNLLLKLNN
ncbi:MarR family transcriptional regulator [Winogradskyella sp. PC-19]|uniref:MarR family winged helix-turn-helix transcriptional regulator n=1 Tax=Winogradskyella sp. PC-19 TaxID=754417 RepID=UPI000B3D4BED|nr:MarR family transcriptional regulator [Winogradskyella sp. PC-19]ARV10369.1 MarR family transcriptional regulator [Winogradskyella sp. PC-19]